MLSNLIVFAASPKDVLMGCKDAVLPKPLLKNHTVNCLTYEENTRQLYRDNLFLFRVLVLHLRGNQQVEGETSKVLDLFMSRMDRLSPSQFHGVQRKDNTIAEYPPLLNILLYDVDIVEVNSIGELARRSVLKHEITVRLLRYKKHICYVCNINAVFRSL